MEKKLKNFKKLKKIELKKDSNILLVALENIIKETSKFILFILIIFCIVVCIVILIGWFKKLDGAVDMFKSIIALLIFITSFYSWKARSENIEKIKKKGILNDAMIMKLIDKNDDVSTILSTINNSDTTAVG